MNVPAGVDSISSAPSSSWASPIRGIGPLASIQATAPGSDSMPAVSSDWNQPGHSALTRTLRRANCRASSRVRLTTAPLLAQ